jgi:hydrogenase nickel incorporation protein HypB
MKSPALPITGRMDRVAEQNRARLDLNRVFAINLVAPPGGGKAALVRRTMQALSHTTSVAQIAIGGPAESKAARLAQAIGRARLCSADLLFVENACDIVCPGSYKIGVQANVRVTTVFDSSATTFDDPHEYQGLDALVVNKVDLARDAGFDEASFLRGLGRSNPNLVVFLTSCTDGRGIRLWTEWVLRRRDAWLPRIATTTGHRRYNATSP